MFDFFSSKPTAQTTRSDNPKNGMQSLVEAATDENKLTEPDWEKNLDICDNIKAYSNNNIGAIHSVRALTSRLQTHNPKTISLTLILTECCMKNCESLFSIALDQPIMSELITIASNNGQDGNENTKETIRLIQEWYDTVFLKNEKLLLLKQAYNILKHKGLIIDGHMNNEINNHHDGSGGGGGGDSAIGLLDSIDLNSNLHPNNDINPSSASSSSQQKQQQSTSKPSTSSSVIGEQSNNNTLEKLNQDLDIVNDQIIFCQEMINAKKESFTTTTATSSSSSSSSFSSSSGSSSNNNVNSTTWGEDEREALSKVVGYLEAYRHRMIDVIEAGTNGLLSEEVFSKCLRLNDAILKTLEAEKAADEIAVLSEDLGTATTTATGTATSEAKDIVGKVEDDYKILIESDDGDDDDDDEKKQQENDKDNDDNINSETANITQTNDTSSSSSSLIPTKAITSKGGGGVLSSGMKSINNSMSGTTNNEFNIDDFLNSTTTITTKTDDTLPKSSGNRTSMTTPVSSPTAAGGGVAGVSSSSSMEDDLDSFLNSLDSNTTVITATTTTAISASNGNNNNDNVATTTTSNTTDGEDFLFN